jgi:hypothetical protein
MNFERLDQYLLEAEGKSKNELSKNNPYREIGFDDGKARLGWVRVLTFSKIEKCLKGLEGILKDKKNFIFIGMGGSINGIKPLISLYNKKRFIFTLDSLDPKACSEIINKIDIKRTLIFPISKSGTTKETQLLASTLKRLFSKEWRKHFCWLSDPTSFSKLDSLGWKRVRKVPIQVDENTDIGGRFSSPHTLIFLLPLYLFLNRNLNKLKEIYNEYLSFQEEIRRKAFYYAQKYKDNKFAYFHPIVSNMIKKEFFSWIIQLFQESLGSKKIDLSVKTLSCTEKEKSFLKLTLNLKTKNPVVSIMCYMYFFQVFIAYYSAFKKINFVTQNFVEKYKETMRKLEKESARDDSFIEILDLSSLIKRIKTKVKRNHKFIEIVLYFHPSPRVINELKSKFKESFSDKIILIFIGSNWNHTSYQAAFMDKHTFYVFLVRPEYKLSIPFLSERDLKENVWTLKLISKATHLTLKNKSVLLSLS